MKKGLKRKNDLSSDENMIEHKRAHKERITKNEEYFSSLGLANK